MFKGVRQGDGGQAAEGKRAASDIANAGRQNDSEQVGAAVKGPIPNGQQTGGELNLFHRALGKSLRPDRPYPRGYFHPPQAGLRKGPIADFSDPQV